MKMLVVLFAAVLLIASVTAPAFAQQQQTPKATEGPDTGKQEPKGTADSDVRKKKKKTSSSVTPKATESPDVGKTDQMNPQ
jgi:cytoskeletal protein RodZ